MSIWWTTALSLPAFNSMRPSNWANFVWGSGSSCLATSHYLKYYKPLKTNFNEHWIEYIILCFGNSLKSIVFSPHCVKFQFTYVHQHYSFVWIIIILSRWIVLYLEPGHYPTNMDPWEQISMNKESNAAYFFHIDILEGAVFSPHCVKFQFTSM